MESDLYNGVPDGLAGLRWPDAHWEEIALLEGCVAAPENLAPQLVFADWLEEHDHNKVADFIRIQCGFWPKQKITPSRWGDAAEAAKAYWQPKFNDGGVECEITADRTEFVPLLEHIGPCRYGRSFIGGLASRVVVGIRTLHKLLKDGRERAVLSLTTDLRAPCEPRESWYGVYGNYGFYSAAGQKARELNERVHKSPFASALTKLNLYGIQKPKLPCGRVQAEKPTWNTYPSRTKTDSSGPPSQSVGDRS